MAKGHDGVGVCGAGSPRLPSSLGYGCEGDFAASSEV